MRNIHGVSSSRGIALAVIVTTSFTSLATSGPATAAIPAPASLCAPPADTVPPQVTALSFSKSTVSLNSASRTVTITAHATDTSGNGAASGVKHVLVYGFTGSSAIALKRTSGTAVDGTWTGSLTVAKYGKPGTRTLNFVRVVDGAKNQNEYFNRDTVTSPTAVQLQSDWPTSITITGTPAKRPPLPKSGKLASFSFSPTTINTKKTTKILHVKAAVTGRQPRRIEVTFNSPNHRRHLTYLVLTKHSGTTWTGQVRINRGIGTRTYQPSVGLDFGSGLRPVGRSYSTDQIESTFFHHSLSVISTRYVKSVATITGLTITPRSIDTTSGAQQVNVKAMLVDAKANIEGAYVVFATVSDGTGYDVSAALHHATGNDWVGTATFQECVPSGRWDAEIYVELPNRAVAHPAKAGRSGLPDHIQVTSTPGDIESPTVTHSSGSSGDSAITLEFSEGVKNVTSSDLSVYALGSSGSNYQSTEPISAVACSNGSGTVDCSGSGGLVTQAVLTVPSLSGHPGSEYEVWANQGSVTSQLTDGAGNPLSWAFRVADVVAS
jgi:hypothetical protein